MTPQNPKTPFNMKIICEKCNMSNFLKNIDRSNCSLKRCWSLIQWTKFTRLPIHLLWICYSSGWSTCWCLQYQREYWRQQNLGKSCIFPSRWMVRKQAAHRIRNMDPCNPSEWWHFHLWRKGKSGGKIDWTGWLHCQGHAFRNHHHLKTTKRRCIHRYNRRPGS